MTAWREGLLLWFRPSVLAHFSSAIPRTVFRHCDDAWVAWTEGGRPARANTPEDLTRFKAEHRQRPAWLRVAMDEILQVPLVMPLASFDHLRSAVHFEIDQVTPFSAEDVVFDTRCESVDVAAGVLHALLVVMPRDRFQSAFETFARAHPDVALFGVDAGDEDNALASINLLPNSQRATVIAPTTWGKVAWGVAAVVLLALGLWRSIDNARARADATTALTKSRQIEARIVAAQEARLNTLVAGARNVLEKQASREDILELSNELAERLPTGVHIERFDLQGVQLQVTGLGSDAATVVARLQGAHAWGPPAVVGGMSTNPLDGRARFSVALPLKRITTR